MPLLDFEFFGFVAVVSVTLLHTTV